MDKEHPETYAQRRANETGRAYLVTMQGHAWPAFPENIRNAEEWAGGVAGLFRPRRKCFDPSGYPNNMDTKD